jgi:hypothetical protein
MDSLLEGTINAFLTLRVGIITRRYCGTLDTFHVRKVRKAAFREASSMLRNIVVQSSGQVVSGIMKATKKAGADTVRSGVGAAERASSRVKNGLMHLAGRVKNTPE